MMKKNCYIFLSVRAFNNDSSNLSHPSTSTAGPTVTIPSSKYIMLVQTMILFLISCNAPTCWKISLFIK